MAENARRVGERSGRCEEEDVEMTEDALALLTRLGSDATLLCVAPVLLPCV